MLLKLASREFSTTWLILSALILFASSSAYALDPTRAITQYHFSTITKKDGLPSLAILGICQTSDDYIWIGTYEGLVRFDGVKFTLYNRSNTNALKVNGIWVIKEARDRTLWVGTNGGGLVSMRNGVWQNYSIKDGLNSDVILSIHEDSKGGLWVGTRKGVAYSWETDGKRYFQPIDTINGKHHENIFSICNDENGVVWIGSETGVFRVEQTNQGYKLVHEPFLNNPPVRAILSDKRGTLWIGTIDKGLVRRTSSGYEQFKVESGFLPNVVTTLLLDRDGQLWIGTMNDGLWRYYNGKFDSFTETQGLSHNLLQWLFEDKEGNIWIGTYRNGLNCLKNSKFLTLTSDEGLVDNSVWQIRSDGADGVWICTQNGLTHWRNGNIESYKNADLGYDTDFRASLVTRNRELYLGSNSSGLFKVLFKNGHPQVVQHPAPILKDISIRAILESSDNHLWIGTTRGLIEVSESTYKIYTTNDGLSVNTISSLFQDSSGRIWIGTNGGGLSYLEQGRIHTYTSKDGLPSDVVFTIL